MRALSLSAVICLSLFPGVGCQPAAKSLDEVLVRIHAVGSAHLEGGSDTNVFRAVAALPESKALLEQTLGRLAQSPRFLFGDGVTSASGELVRPLMRPLLDDVVRQESFLEVVGRDGRPQSWVLAVAVGPERLGIWRTNVVELSRLWGGKDVKVGASDGKPGGDAAFNHGWRLRWAESDGWFVAGAGTGGMPSLTRALAALKQSGRPVGVLAAPRWLEATVDAKRLAGVLGLPGGRLWPRVEFAVQPRGEDLRMEGRARFEDAMIGRLPPWQVPTNTISEPLISFFAARGVAACVKEFDVIEAFKLSSTPAEVYAWGQGLADYQMFLALPVAEATNQVRRAVEREAGAIQAAMGKLVPGKVVWREALQKAVWEGLPPFLQGTVEGVHDGGRDYLVAGLFPGAKREPAPQELLSQLNRPELAVYSWEATQPRLAQWLRLSQFLSLVREESQLTTNMVAMRWLRAVEPRLGNVVTEATRQSATELGLVRKAGIGLSSMEIIGLVRWLESKDFPKVGLVLPETSRPARTPKPALPKK